MKSEGEEGNRKKGNRMNIEEGKKLKGERGAKGYNNVRYKLSY